MPQVIYYFPVVLTLIGRIKADKTSETISFMAIKKTFPKRASSRPSDGKKPFRRRGSKNKSSTPADPNAQRLNKILASAGLGSRRDVEELIIQGRVEIDREIVTDLSRKVDPRTVVIKVDGSVLKKEQLIYYALNKPSGVLSTNRDPDGRMRVIDLVPDKHRVFSVGRLDRSSEGLILLTNDGELAQRLAHPKFAVQKAYFVVVSGVMTQEELDKLRKGVHLAEGFARIDGATIRRQRKGCTEIEIVLSEGKNREIRRILARAGHKVVVLRRIAIGPLRLGQLPVGASRILLPSEVRALYAATERKPVDRKKTNSAAGKAVTAQTVKSKRPSRKSTLDDMDDDEALPIQTYKNDNRGRANSENASDDDAPVARGRNKSKPVGGKHSSANHDRFDDLDDDFEEDDFADDHSSEVEFDGNFALGQLDDDFDSSDFDSGDFDDDDFVGHFSSSTAGAVLDYDSEEPGAPNSKQPRKSASSSRATERSETRPSGRNGGKKQAKSATPRGVTKHESNRAAGPVRKAAKGGKRSNIRAGGRTSRPTEMGGRPEAGRSGAGKKSSQPSKSRGNKSKSKGPKGR